jgi:hypothetical protein
MKRIYFLSVALVTIVLSSCQKKPDVGGTTPEKMANEWWVQLYDPAGGLAYSASYHGHMETYNSSANDNTIWIDDFPVKSGGSWGGDIWGFKIKAVADLNNLTFSAKQSVSALDGYNIKVNVTDGKIIENGGHSKTGVLTDSIYMKIEFEDDPGTIYSIRGHARTRFAEDDY